MTKHGMRHTRLYKIWEAMKRRCDSPKAERYPRYGGRGIRYCEEWKNFIPFMEWAFENGYVEGLSIERIDTDGNYCPENCKWIPLKQQANNTSQNRHVTMRGEKMTIAQFAEKLGAPYSAVYQEICILHWSPEKCAERWGFLR